MLSSTSRFDNRCEASVEIGIVGFIEEERWGGMLRFALFVVLLLLF